MWLSSCSFRVRIALHLKNLDFEYLTVNVRKSEHTQHQNLSGTKHIPQLTHVDAQVSLSQSMAIFQYLDSISDHYLIFPTDPILKAQVFEIAEIVNSFMQPLQLSSMLNSIEKMDDNFDRKRYCQKFMHQGLTAIENLILSDHNLYCVGDQISAADLFLYPMVVNCLTRYDLDLKNYPKIEKIMQNLKNQEAILKAHPKNQIDTPEDIDFSTWAY